MSALYRRTLRKAQNAVVLVRNKGLKDIVSRRLLAPLGIVRLRSESRFDFPPFEPRIAPARSRVRVAALVDAEVQRCLEFDAEVLSMASADEEALAAFAPALALVATHAVAAKGAGAADTRRVAQLMAFCRNLGLPTVLWVDEPRGFERHLELARGFERVFVHDPAEVPLFREALGHERVECLPLAIQPALHNPMQRAERPRALCFVGTKGELEHFGDSRHLFEVAVGAGLDILEVAPGGRAPVLRSESSGALRGSVDYERLLTAYRSYRAFLQGALDDSPKLRRALEICACQTWIWCASVASAASLPPSARSLVRSANEAPLGQTAADDPALAATAHRAYRELLREHGYGERLTTIRRALGAPPEQKLPPKVSVLVASNRPERLDNILKNYEGQSHPQLELLIMLNSDGYDLGEVRARIGARRDVQVFQLDEALTLADCLNHGLQQASGDWVAKFDDDDLYGADYLADLLLCTRFTDAPVLGKRAYHVHFEATDRTALRFARHAHRHVEFVHGATLFVRRDVFEQVRFTPVRQGTDTLFQRACRERGLGIYSSDPYNFVHVRHSGGGAHTWGISDEELLEKASQVRSGLPLDEIMI